MTDDLWHDICFCDYKGQCPHRASCRRSLTEMRKDGYRCFMKREEKGR